MSQQEAVDAAFLPTLDLSRLVSSDAEERQKLVRACEVYGFFYLDLRSDAELIALWTGVLDLMGQYFNLSLDEKMRDSRNSDTHGYEPVATSTGAQDDLPDYYESLKASRDEVLTQSSKLAPAVKANHALLNRFIERAHAVTMMILRQLSIALELDDSHKFEAFHRHSEESLSTLSMFRYPKQEVLDVGVGHNKHTDIGTLTFLLCQQQGLQVLSKDPVGWRFVQPLPGCAVINVGDTLRFLSGSRFRSAVHRVIPVDQLQRQDRFSIAYFLRAENNATLNAVGGRTVSAKDWHDEKFDVFRKSREAQASDDVLTGGMERDM
ncbi:hypothetical protein ANO11243_029920 [Dothideomycetidae sp. 11243]|uniref:2-oxoglutarate-dependent dioxygenase frbH n=1 Tax=Dothideomycetidae sp. (strain 11243) TaxID=1603295 RepID=FRBH_DOTX1|nr:RecName: Full=2-oxoglutarate-dependent dioxygenase frbH; AltName: Full=FR901469 biosynthesis cluster protein H [fungal sp. No.11243]GAM84989.1 hypothetical protein ANO11243_029920 [fungal sp. No.11243]